MAEQPSRRVQDWIKEQPIVQAGDWIKEPQPVPAGPSRRAYRSRRTRRSLDDALQNDPAACGAIPVNISLPESVTTRDDDSLPGDRGRKATRSSLELIDRGGSLILPSLIPLPDSRSPSPIPPRARAAVEKSSAQTYHQILDRAAGVFDHIKHGKARRDPRLEKIDITLYQFYHDNSVNSVELYDSESVYHYRDITEGLKSRVFIVEDLSKSTIHSLGAAFGVTPEFFEEHLLNSGYDGAQYDDLSSRSWKTAGLAKSYVSIQWFRPIYRQPPIFSHRDKEKLLDGESDGLECVSGNSTITLKAETNIFRSEWDLRIDPMGATKKMNEFGLVERASIWRQSDEDKDYEIVIMLLDPLPTISIGYDRTVQIPRDDDHLQGSSGDYDDYLDDPTSIQRIFVFPDAETSEVHEIQIGNMRPEPATPWLDWLRGKRKPGVIQGKVHTKTSSQVLLRQMAPRKTITIDLDQALVTGVNLDTLQGDLDETRSTREELLHIMNRQPTSARLADALFELIRHDTLTLLRVLHHILEDMEVDVLDDTKMEGRLPLWRQLISQAQMELPELKSSTRGFLAFFGIVGPENTSSPTTQDPAIEKNVSHLFQEIDQMLARLRRASDSLTSNMGLLESRRSIDEAHAVTRLTELAFLFIPLSFSASIFGMQVEPFKDSAPLWKFFLVAIVVTMSAYLMRITMRSQWLDNVKRSVKLDVRRYAEQRNLPVQVRTMSMLLLLQWVGSTLMASIRKTSTRTKDNARRAGIRLWGVVRFPISFVLLIGVVALAPVTVLWTRNLDAGVQGTVTLVILLSIIALVGTPYWRRTDPSSRNALPNLVKALFRRIPRRTLYWSLLLLGITGFAAIPLALIWTRPLAAGIKAGLTAAILVIVLTGLGIIVMDRLYHMTTGTHSLHSGYLQETEGSSTGSIP